MNRPALIILLLVGFVSASFISQLDNKTLLTGGSQKTWSVEYFLLNGSDFTESVNCIKGIDVTFRESDTYTTINPCTQQESTGYYIVEDDILIMGADTFALEELTHNKFKYSFKKKSKGSFEGQEYFEMEHTYTTILYPKD